VKTFIFQILASLIIGYLASSAVSFFILKKYDNNVKYEFNIYRVNSVIESFSEGDNKPIGIWKFRFDDKAPSDLPNDENIISLTKPYGERFVSVTFDNNKFKDQHLLFKRKMIVIIELLIQLLITIIVLLVTFSHWTTGLRKLSYLSNCYAHGKFKVRTPISGPHLIKRLIQNQHDMAQKIETLQDRQKAIFSSLPHDIRTPLSSIQITIDMLTEELSYDNGKMSFLCDRLNNQISSLNMVCESSLYLLKTHNSDSIAKNNTSFKQALTNVIIMLDQEKQYKIIDSDFEIATDEKMLNVLLTNILSNSARYCNKKVSVSCTHYPRWHVIKFDDDGPGFNLHTIANFNDNNLSQIESEGFGLGFILIKEISLRLAGLTLLSNTQSGGRVTLLIKRNI